MSTWLKLRELAPAYPLSLPTNPADWGREDTPVPKIACPSHANMLHCLAIVVHCYAGVNMRTESWVLSARKLQSLGGGLHSWAIHTA